MQILATESVQSELGQRLRSGRSTEGTARTIVAETAAALLLRAGYRARIHGLSMQASEAAYIQAERDHGPEGCDLRRVSRDVLSIIGAPDPGNARDRLAAAFSSATGAAALQTVFGTMFTTALNASADTTAGWVAERTILDLREQRRLRVGMPGTMEKLPRGTTAQHALLDVKGGESFWPARFARQLTIDEQDAVEHDLQPILDGATLLGRAAGSLRSDLVYSVVLANRNLADGVALFDAGHSNLATGAALAVATLDVGLAAMRKQTENGHVVSAAAGYLLVPAELEGLAGRLVRDLTSPGMKPLQVRAEPRLSLGVVNPATGDTLSGSATSWYLASDASAAPSLEFAARTPQPTIRSFALTEGRWGLGYDIAWDVGACALSHVGIRRADA